MTLFIFAFLSSFGFSKLSCESVFRDLSEPLTITLSAEDSANLAPFLTNADVRPINPNDKNWAVLSLPNGQVQFRIELERVRQSPPDPTMSFLNYNDLSNQLILGIRAPADVATVSRIFSQFKIPPGIRSKSELYDPKLIMKFISQDKKIYVTAYQEENPKMIYLTIMVNKIHLSLIDSKSSSFQFKIKR